MIKNTDTINIDRKHFYLSLFLIGSTFFYFILRDNNNQTNCNIDKTPIASSIESNDSIIKELENTQLQLNQCEQEANENALLKEFKMDAINGFVKCRLSANCNRYELPTFRPALRDVSEFKKIKDILLIINFNHFASQMFCDVVPVLYELYNPYFENIVLSFDDKPNYYDNCTHLKSTKNIKAKTRSGHQMQLLIQVAHRLYPDFSGYFVINDDSLINPWLFGTFNRETFWLHSQLEFLDVNKGITLPIANVWIHMNPIVSTIAKQIPDKNLEQISKFTTSKMIWTYGGGDVFYVPKKHLKEFVYLCEKFEQYNIIMELIIPTVMLMIEPFEKWVLLRSGYTWGAPRRSNFSSDAFDFFHPAKLSFNDTTDNVLQYHRDRKKSIKFF